MSKTQPQLGSLRREEDEGSRTRLKELSIPPTFLSPSVLCDWTFSTSKDGSSA